MMRKRLTVAKIINHENYKTPTSVSNDITLLMLEEELDLNIYTPACLAQTGETTTYDGENENFCGFKFFTFDIKGKTAQAAGWGAINPQGSILPNLLQEVSLKVATQEECAKVWNNLQPGMICAGGVGGKDTCGVS